jgi:hypothetical protein
MPLKLPFYFLAACMLHDPAFHCFLDKIPPHFFGAEDTILPSVPQMEFLDIKLIKKNLRLLLHSQSHTGGCF